MASPSSPTGPADRASTGPAHPRAARWARALEISQDVITVAVGILFVLLAAALLGSGLAAFVHTADRSLSPSSVTTAAYKLLDIGLFVLILAEIVHTVVLSLRTHRLIAQPFLIVGLVAVIRRILALLGSSAPFSTTEFAVLTAMVAVFVGGLIAVNRFGNASETDALSTPVTTSSSQG